MNFNNSQCTCFFTNTVILCSSCLRKIACFFRCKEFGQAVLCYNKFKKCHNKTLKVTPSLCRNDCHLFRNKYCKKELEMISQEKAILAMYIPDCDVLPEPNPDCIPLSRKHDNPHSSRGSVTCAIFGLFLHVTQTT